MSQSLFQDLLKRRVPQIVGIYLAVGWGVLEFTDWLIGRYNISPALADLGLAAWVCMIPTVVTLAYLHGAEGGQRWTRIEKIGIPVNVGVAVLVLLLVASRGPIGGTGEAGGRPLLGGALEPTRIAVLYFDDESESSDQTHLANAFTGALIDELAQVPALDIVPRSAVKPYRDTSVPLDSIGRVVKAGTIVEGSVLGSRDDLLVSVTLIDAITQSSMGNFTLQGTVDEWTELRSELAAEVADNLRQRLGIEIAIRERQAGTESSEALALVERAEQLAQEVDELSSAGDTVAVRRAFADADSLLAMAETLDPTWVEPIVLRGRLASRRANLSTIVPSDFVQDDLLEGLYHAERALLVDPGDAGALELRGRLRFRMSENPKLTEPAELRAAAERDLRAAVAADPFRAGAWSVLSNLHRVQTKYAEAKRDAERALEADPFLAEADVVIFRLYEISLELRDIGEAAQWCLEGRRRFPETEYFVSSYLFLLALSGGPDPDPQQAWALADTVLQFTAPQERDPMRHIMHTWVAGALARAGQADSAVAVSERARAAASSSLRPWIDYYSANVRMLLGQYDEALALLSDFLEEVPQRKQYIASDWMFEDLWDDPRFRALVATDE